jgi:DNA-binding LacI/PurR family transcriptional regulator
MIVPNLINPHYTELVDTASRLCAGHDYYLLLATSRDDAEFEAKALTDVVSQVVEGLLWVPTQPNPAQLEHLQAQGIPVVAIGRRVEGDAVDTVVFEDFGGTQAAAQHLINLGHRRIGYLGGDVRHSSNRSRYEGFAAALEKAGIEIDDGLVKVGSTRTSWGHRACNEMLASTNPPTALCVGSNALMPGVFGALRDRGLSIPDDISLICFDDVEWFSYAIPPLTAVKADHERLAEAALDIVLSRMEDPQDEGKEPVLVTIDFELVLRRSTAPPKR